MEYRNLTNLVDDRGPEVMVAVTDKLGERWVRLQFGIEKFPKRKAGPETISIGWFEVNGN